MADEAKAEGKPEVKGGTPAQRPASESRTDGKGGKPAPQSAPQPADQRPEKRYEGYLAEVVDINPTRTGIYGEIQQAMCKIMEGKDRGRVIRRNVAGRIAKGDIIRLPDTTREDKPIRAR